jgi:nucleoside-diphosphate-sugar epimerase
MRIAVTGAGGFVGRELCAVLRTHGHTVIEVGRSVGADDTTAWDIGTHGEVLRNAAAVIHLAARAHVIKERAADPIAEFRRSNVQGSLSIARAAIEAAVPRFVFVSSIGVLGSASADRVFTETTVPAPTEPYAVSKLEAEIALRDLERTSGLEVTVVRPPLVYGPSVRGNFLRLLRLVDSGIPLPFGSLTNQRSFVGVTNLAHLLIACATEQPAAGGLFLASDGQDISTADLLRLLASEMGKPSRIFACPMWLLRVMTSAIGQHVHLTRLSGTLRVDSSRARSVLGWNPPKDLATGLHEMVASYREQTHG